MNSSDAQVAYSMLDQMISRNYLNSFPEKWISKSYKNRLPWVTTELKMMIKHKNKLHRLTLKHPTQLNIERYRQYKRFLNGKTPSG